MSHIENDKIKEACFEDFEDLYFTSTSFQGLIDELIGICCDEWTKDQTSRIVAFEKLWQNDCELLCRNKRVAAEALILYINSMNHLRSLT